MRQPRLPFSGAGSAADDLLDVLAPRPVRPRSGGAREAASTADGGVNMTTTIKELRQLHGLTLSDVGERLGVSRQAVHLIERRGVSAQLRTRYAAVFGCDPGEIPVRPAQPRKAGLHCWTAEQ